MQYPTETFTEAERELLSRHCTNLDRPVFALVNLPETLKGALFARYSRYPGTLRRLLLDEFAADLPRPAGRADRSRASGRRSSTSGSSSATAMTRSPSSGGAHVACEWVSNVLTKILQRPRLAAYLEQSTRYIAYDAPMPDPPGGYRYYRDPELGVRLRRGDGRAVRYLRGGAAARSWPGPRSSTRAATTSPQAAHTRAIKAKALDLLRGLLPASSLSHMGIYASGQTYEQLILHLLAHPLPEARDVRHDDPGGGAGRDPELCRSRAAARSRRRLGRLPGGARAQAGERLGAAARASTQVARDEPAGPSVALLSRRRRRGRPAVGAAVRVVVGLGGGDPRRVRGSERAEREASCCRTWWASAPTAATAPAAASRRCATGLRSSPTTAPSAISSATGC